MRAPVPARGRHCIAERGSGALDGKTSLARRRALFCVLLAVVGLPTSVAALLPDEPPSAEATVIVGAPAEPEQVVEPLPSTDPPREEVSTMTEEPATPASVAATRSTTTVTTRRATTTTAARPAAVTTSTTDPGPAVTRPPVAAPPPAPGPAAGAEEQAVLACLRRRESGGNYQIVSANRMYFGAYQFLQSSWDSVARHAGRADLVGVPPNTASPADQDAMAIALYHWQGLAPWGGACG